ncbi:MULTISPECIES: citrate/2-methylcitrate synthase [unclassified Bradyrhizobium]|uniref:citrate/2-methylcitrate synthase n=1 Tax=unclassified Bradyrhizobium TaxID=2631580 RepID=UPI002915ED6D|nr:MULTISPECIES: citrate/2-methylcitrate synthase [unclassified Bradyrhizobium]
MTASACAAAYAGTDKPGHGQAEFERLDSVISSTLGIEPELVTADLSYQDIAEWDSMGHVSLMLALEKAFATTISHHLVSQLTSVSSLRAFVAQLSAAGTTAQTLLRKTELTHQSNTLPSVNRGLVGIYFDWSSITEIDPSGSALRYRGYSIDDLVSRASYEETTFLLIEGRLPGRSELASFSDALRLYRSLPAPIGALLQSMSTARPFHAMQAALAALSAFAEDDESADISVIARSPTLIGAFHRLRCNAVPLSPRDDLGHAANLLYMLRGEVPEPLEEEVLDKTFILLADHSSSASTFTARIAASTNADRHAALSSAIAAFSGPLHGGAVNEVIAMAEQIGSPDRAAAFVRDRLDRNEVVYGFGHRIYRAADPRARLLRGAARRLCEARGDTRILEILEAVAASLTDYSRLGLDINVDFYASAVFEALRIPRDLFGPVFVAARMAGLVAHIREQRSNNTLIRPQLLYVGPAARAYEQGVTQ